MTVRGGVEKIESSAKHIGLLLRGEGILTKKEVVFI